MCENSLVQYLEMLQFSGIDYIHSKFEEPQLSLKQKEYQNCTKCQLHENRINFVYGEGNPDARIMFIGEGPGREENLQGKPFVGKSGQLLTKMLNAINLKRDEVYIANIVKCQPPNNRNPVNEEINACLPYLKEQIEIINPSIIVLLGKVATASLLADESPLSTLRNRNHSVFKIKTFVTYHPSALLRNPSLKKQAWIDLQKVQKNLELHKHV